MAFSFGAPAPSSGGFGGFGGFGSPSPAPAGGGFSFGGSNPAPAPSFSFGGGSSASTPPSSNTSLGFSFGGGSRTTAPAPSLFGQPAPAPSLFGQPAPAPATGGFSFGASSFAPAPASTGFSFGSPAPAPSSTGFSFGSPAPAPSSTGFSFGSPAAAAPSSGFSFGQPAPAPATVGFSFPQPPAPGAPPGTAAAAPPLSGITGKTPYSALPPEYKKAIDDIHEAMMKHKKSMIHVQAMGPQPLTVSSGEHALPVKLKSLHQSLNELQQNVQDLQAVATRSRDEDRKTIEQVYMYAKWPTEAMAARRGVRLSPAEEKKDTDSSSSSSSDTQAQLREMLERQIPYVDRIERMPSPYLWQTLDSMAQHLHTLTNFITTLRQELERSKSLEDTGVVNLAEIVANQDQFLYTIRRDIHKINYNMNKLRAAYTAFETGENVVEKAQMEEWEHEKGIEEQIQMQLLRSASAPQPPKPLATYATIGGGTSAPAPGGGLFGSAPAPSGGLFGSAPAPFSFGASAPGAPAPAGGFGIAKPSAPAPTMTPKKKSNRSRR